MFAAQWKATPARQWPEKTLVHATAVTIALKDDLHPTHDAWELPVVTLAFRQSPKLQETPHAYERKASSSRTTVRMGLMTGDRIYSCYCIIPDTELTQTL